MPESGHYLVSASGVRELSRDKRIRFGRVKGNQVRLANARVSRRHAELFWNGQAMVINDLNSNNGTFVNDKQITSHQLADRDRIDIGSHIFVYCQADDPADLQETREQLVLEASEVCTMGGDEDLSPVPDTDFSGSLHATSIIELCQMLDLGQRSGLLTVQTHDQQKATLYFAAGQVTGAEFGELTGNAAAMDILQLQEGQFTFRNGDFAALGPVTQTTSFLLLEVMRRADESRT